MINGKENVKAANFLIFESSLKMCFFVCLFIVFLLPKSFDVGGDGVSGNYLFMLFPIFICFFSRKVLVPNQNIKIIICSYILIFAIGLLYQYEYYQFVDRRLISFILFMSTFCFMFIRINKEMIVAFKLSIVGASIFASTSTISTYIVMGIAEMGGAGKGFVGSQRYGFVYVMAIWLVILYIAPDVKFKILKYTALTVLFAGLLLTFSRSGIIAMIGSSLFYCAYKIKKDISIKKLINIKLIISFLFFFLIIVAISQLLVNLFPSTIDFFSERLFSLENSSGKDIYDFHDPEASEGYRIFLLKKIVEFVLSNPFTGSGYLGIWILFEDLSGSAHNQYLDVLFRTGVIGFFIYIWLLYRIMKFLKYSDQGLFWGMLGVIIYGLFHETFKLSYGSFILSFILGMMMQFSLKKENRILNKQLLE